MDSKIETPFDPCKLCTLLNPEGLELGVPTLNFDLQKLSVIPYESGFGLVNLLFGAATLKLDLQNFSA